MRKILIYTINLYKLKRVNKRGKEKRIVIVGVGRILLDGSAASRKIDRINRVVRTQLILNFIPFIRAEGWIQMMQQNDGGSGTGFMIENITMAPSVIFSDSRFKHIRGQRDG